MGFIQRTKLVPKPVLNVPVRKHRFTTQNNAAVRAARAKVGKEEIEEILKLVAESEYQIDEAVARKDLAYKRMEEILREHNLQEHSNGVHTVELVEQFTRQSRTIDPKKFRAKVASDDFWTAISVSINAAESLLTEKEMNEVSDVVRPKSMGYVFKCKKVDRRKK